MIATGDLWAPSWVNPRRLQTHQEKTNCCTSKHYQVLQGKHYQVQEGKHYQVQEGKHYQVQEGKHYLKWVETDPIVNTILQYHFISLLSLSLRN